MRKLNSIDGLWDDLVGNGFGPIVDLADLLPSDGYISSDQFAELLVERENLILTQGESRRQINLYKAIFEKHLGPMADVALFRT